MTVLNVLESLTKFFIVWNLRQTVRLQYNLILKAFCVWPGYEAKTPVAPLMMQTRGNHGVKTNSFMMIFIIVFLTDKGWHSSNIFSLQFVSIYLGLLFLLIS